MLAPELFEDLRNNRLYCKNIQTPNMAMKLSQRNSKAYNKPHLAKTALGCIFLKV